MGFFGSRRASCLFYCAYLSYLSYLLVITSYLLTLISIPELINKTLLTEGARVEDVVTVGEKSFRDFFAEIFANRRQILALFRRSVAEIP